MYYIARNFDYGTFYSSVCVEQEVKTIVDDDLQFGRVDAAILALAQLPDEFESDQLKLTFDSENIMAFQLFSGVSSQFSIVHGVCVNYIE